MSTLAALWVSFFWIGLGAWGGGQATIPLIEHELVARRAWLTGPEFVEVITIAQMTPGPVAINAATLCGWRKAGVAGATLATLGFVTPTVVVVVALLLLLDRVVGRSRVDRVKRALAPGVLGLVALAALAVGRECITDAASAFVALASGLLLFWLKERVPAVLVLVGFGLLGLVVR